MPISVRSRQTMLAVLALSLALIGVLTLGLHIGCSGDDSSTDSNDGGNTGSTIGPDGGTYADASGVIVVVPAGALDNDITVTVDYHEDQYDLPDSLLSSICGVIGAVTLGPDGQIFNSPITVTIPINTYCTPGEPMPLFVWNDSDQAWEQTESIATVTASGLAVTAQISHFSTYSPADGYGADGIFGNLEPQNWLDAEAAFNAWSSNFRTYVRNLDYKRQIKDCCMRVSRLEFSITYQGSIDYSNEVAYGEAATYYGVEDFEVTRGTPGSTFYLHLQARVYWTTQAPDRVVVDTEWDHIDLTNSASPTSSISARAECGEDLMFNTPIDFMLTGPGSIDPQFANSGNSGYATALFTATDTGLVTIEAEAKTCLAAGGLLLQSGTTQIQVDSCNNWQLYIQMNFQHVGDNWTFYDNLEMDIPLTIDQQGHITSTTGVGSQYPDMTSTNEHCSVSSENTPDFLVYAEGDISGENIVFSVAPVGFVADYTMTCVYDNQTINYPLPPYTYLLPAIMSGQVFVDFSIPFTKGYTKTGSGFDTNDDENPIAYEYLVRIDCSDHK